MIKFLIIIGIIGYVFRRILFTPIPGSARSERMEKDQADAQGFTDYEELED